MSIYTAEEQANIERVTEGWISVEDRLPEKAEYPYSHYLCWTKSWTGPVRSGIHEVVAFDNEKGKFLPSPCRLQITHWQPLPEPPEGK